jgi:pSer/pThr/pTyr-binding forkhead associated (FHA) protein
VCGEFLAPGTRSVVHIPRPSLGRLQLDDGDIVGLDQELLIGRNPDRDTDASRATLRRVKTVGDKVSRSHLEVRFQGWDVLVADCGSTNGTFVVPHPGGQVAALEPGRPQMIDAGAVVYFGSRSFTVLGRDEA